MHPLYGDSPWTYVPVRVTLGDVVAHRYTYSIPRCRFSQYHRTFIPLSVSMWNNLVDHVFDGGGLAGFKRMANAFFLTCSCSIPFVFFCFSISLRYFCLVVGIVGLGSLG